MKKFKLGIILLALSLSMILVSCGGTPEEKVAKYVEEALAATDTQTMFELNKQDGCDVTVVAEGTSLVRRCVYTTDIDILGGTEYVKAELESILNNETWIEAEKNALAGIQADECASVTALKSEYYDNQGNLLASTEVK